MKRLSDVLLLIYRNILSPNMLHGCRFIPSCSEYARDAMTVLSLRQAALKILWRICRCHPWSPAGYDPVPPPAGQGRSMAFTTVLALRPYPLDFAHGMSAASAEGSPRRRTPQVVG